MDWFPFPVLLARTAFRVSQYVQRILSTHLTCPPTFYTFRDLDPNRLLASCFTSFSLHIRWMYSGVSNARLSRFLLNPPSECFAVPFYLIPFSFVLMAHTGQHLFRVCDTQALHLSFFPGIRLLKPLVLLVLVRPLDDSVLFFSSDTCATSSLIFFSLLQLLRVTKLWSLGPVCFLSQIFSISARFSLPFHFCYYATFFSLDYLDIFPR